MFISQTTDFHFVSSHFVSQTTVSLCDIGYWIRVNTVQKVKRKIYMLPKYVGSFTAEVRTVFLPSF